MMTVQIPRVCIPFTIVFDKVSCNVENSAQQKFEIPRFSDNFMIFVIVSPRRNIVLERKWASQESIMVLIRASGVRTLPIIIQVWHVGVCPNILSLVPTTVCP